jgi:hypothetical protein
LSSTKVVPAAALMFGSWPFSQTSIAESVVNQKPERHRRPTSEAGGALEAGIEHGAGGRLRQRQGGRVSHRRDVDGQRVGRRVEIDAALAVPPLSCTWKVKVA